MRGACSALIACVRRKRTVASEFSCRAEVKNVLLAASYEEESEDAPRKQSATTPEQVYNMYFVCFNQQ